MSTTAIRMALQQACISMTLGMIIPQPSQSLSKMPSIKTSSLPTLVYLTVDSIVTNKLLAVIADKNSFEEHVLPLRKFIQIQQRFLKMQ